MVTGSREWPERTIIRSELAMIHAAAFPLARPTLVHGAARGADSIAAEIAEGLGWAIEAHPADWRKWGKAAGPIRNRAMLESGVDRVLAFCLGGSAGTRHAINLALAAGLPTSIWEAEPGNLPGATLTVHRGGSTYDPPEGPYVFR